MKKSWEEYEFFVKELQETLLNAEKLGLQKNIAIEHHKIIKDNAGIEREFDLYWEYEFGGLVYKTIIECKDYKAPVSIEKIDALIGKVRDIPGLRLVFATKVGYQNGAEIKAKQNGVELLVVRKPTAYDWVDENGVSLIRSVDISFQIQYPARILNFDPLVDKKVYDENQKQPIFEGCLSNELLINDGLKTLSFFDLENQLGLKHKENWGVFEDSVKFEKEGRLSSPSQELTILGYNVKYEVRKPEEVNFTVNASEHLYGVLEYLSNNQKILFWRNGRITKVPRQVLD